MIARLLTVWCAVTRLPPGAACVQDSTVVRADLARWLARSWPPVTLARGARLNDSLWTLTRRFYAGRGGEPGWDDAAAGGAGGRVAELLERLQRSREQGLDSTDYGLPLLRALSAQRADDDARARLDILATASWLHYASDLAYGRVVARVADSLWTAAPRSVDLLGRLAAALDSDRVGAELDDLAPPQAAAQRLRAALAWYRTIAARGGWPVLPAGPPLRLGDTGSTVALLRRRLEVTGDLAVAGSDGAAALFDSALETGVRRAQTRHGLDPDGIVGRATQAALNVPVEARIRQMELNLERWRWLPRDPGSRYVMVNSAGFALQVVDSGRVILTSRIVAGRVSWPTPIFSSRITEVTFNPRWNIPRSIAVREILPRLRRDPDYLRRMKIHVERDVAGEAVELSCGEVAWDSVTRSGFVYRLWQEPGPLNPLGRIRFTIPSRFGVALHDTQEPALFNAYMRASSHGCVRVQEAERIAVWVLGLAGWSEDSVRAVEDLGEERYVAVRDSIPVYVTYWTAWMDDGQVSFRPDLYRWDARLAEALRRRK